MPPPQTAGPTVCTASTESAIGHYPVRSLASTEGAACAGYDDAPDPDPTEKLSEPGGEAT